MSRSIRLRSNFGKDHELSGPEAKRRRLGNNGLTTVATCTAVPARIGNGPRTRGMIETNDSNSYNSSSNVPSITNGPSEKLSSSGSAKKTGDGNGTTQRERDTDRETCSGQSSSESSDSDTDSSDLDGPELDSKRTVYHDEISDIEKQFSYLRELVYKDRVIHADKTLRDIRAGTAKEYLMPLETLQNNMTIRIQQAAFLRDCQMQSLQNKIDAEALAAHQNYESDKALVVGDIRSGLEERIHMLEEDRNNDFTSELWLDTVLKRKNKKTTDIFGEKKKKPVTVSGPFIVYMLNDVDIVEDWTVLKKALTAPKRKLYEFTPKGIPNLLSFSCIPRFGFGYPLP